MSNNLEYMREHNCKHLKNCSHASVVEYQYSDELIMHLMQLI